MNKISSMIVRHRKAIIISFVIAGLVSAVLQSYVKKNYNMVDYLPEDAQSTKALEIMNKEFTESMPNANVMMKNISLMEAVEFKQQLTAIEGVTQVVWLDDMIDLKQPLEMSDPETVEGFYKNGNALYSVTIAKGAEKSTCKAIRELIGEDNLLAGEAPDLAQMQLSTVSEVTGAMLILIPAIIFLLVMSTSSWLEPLLFMATIGISVLINMGTNIIFGQISFMTNSISPILQLAVSLDYAIFLLHSFADYRKQYDDVKEAMKYAIKDSMVTVAASALTTLFGFLALIFMKFGIGADLGMNLAKGIILSFLSSMLFLPALTLLLYRWLDKTQHRPFMPGFTHIGKLLTKLSLPVVILVLILIVPGFLGQGQTSFAYGNGGISEGSRSGQDRAVIESEFGKSTIMVLLVPRGDITKEQMLGEELHKLEHVTGILSYANTVGTVIPPEYLGEDITNRFYSDQYARIIIYTDTEEEGDIAFETVGEIREIATGYYGDNAYSLGQSANLFDMKNVVQKDNILVNLIAIISIFLVLLFTLKSLTLPFILLVTIEAGIWFNLSIPYFAGVSINFIGFLVLSTVQLGATVDYAILLTDRYMKNRKELRKQEAILTSLGETFKSILVSAATLSIAGFTLYATSSNDAASDIGLLLGRGTIFSFLMVLCFLPAMLLLFDRAIGRTTLNSNFKKKEKHNKHNTLNQ